MWFQFSPQDLFISRVTKTLSKTNKLSRLKKRGWFSKEAMTRVLNWSAPPSYITIFVVATPHFFFCYPMMLQGTPQKKIYTYISYIEHTSLTCQGLTSRAWSNIARSLGMLGGWRRIFYATSHSIEHWFHMCTSKHTKSNTQFFATSM